MAEVHDEHKVCEVEAVRKGRSRSRCTVRVAISDDGEVILRTLDKSGTAPIVAVLGRAEALQLAAGLAEASEKVEGYRSAAARRALRRGVGG